MKKLTTQNKDYDTIVVSSITKDKNIYFDKNVIVGNKILEFEGRKLPVVNNIDEYLKTFYGDYMVLPPENKRYGHDTGDDIIYDFNNSYKKYMGDK